jgi:hypothetical protein
MAASAKLMVRMGSLLMIFARLLLLCTGSGRRLVTYFSAPGRCAATDRDAAFNEASHRTSAQPRVPHLLAIICPLAITRLAFPSTALKVVQRACSSQHANQEEGCQYYGKDKFDVTHDGHPMSDHSHTIVSASCQPLAAA